MREIVEGNYEGAIALLEKMEPGPVRDQNLAVVSAILNGGDLSPGDPFQIFLPGNPEGRPELERVWARPLRDQNGEVVASTILSVPKYSPVGCLDQVYVLRDEDDDLHYLKTKTSAHMRRHIGRGRADRNRVFAFQAQVLKETEQDRFVAVAPWTLILKEPKTPINLSEEVQPIDYGIAVREGREEEACELLQRVSRQCEIEIWFPSLMERTTDQVGILRHQRGFKCFP